MKMVLVCGYSICKFKLIVQKFLYENFFYSLDEYFELKKNKFIYILSKLVFESLAYKIYIHFCLFYSLTTHLVFVFVFLILFCM
jgi:hypothetical protein